MTDVRDRPEGKYQRKNKGKNKGKNKDMGNSESINSLVAERQQQLMQSGKDNIQVICKDWMMFDVADAMFDSLIEIPMKRFVW